MHGQVAVAELLLTLDANLLNRHDINYMTAIDYAVQVTAFVSMLVWTSLCIPSCCMLARQDRFSCS